MTSAQVDKEHYAFGSYGFEGRFVSYYWQLREVLSRKPASILEVGVGDNVFGNFVRANTPVSYRSLDIAADLKPDVIGSILEMPQADKSADISCAFEVLEHLPYDDVPQALGELARVARQYVVISIPHFGPMISFSLKIPFIPQIRFAYKVPVPKSHVFNGQHYWELGKRGYPVAKFRTLLSTIGRIEHDFIPFNSEYHHFFIVRVNPSV